jgi:protein-S-isoprenylcysteine O-methyltransferase Ste14
MLKLPPPIWTLIYLAAAAAASWALGWPMIPGLPQPVIGGTLFFVAWLLPMWAFRLFQVEGTEIDPISPTNAKLVVRGPFRFTRNPMYLGLTLSTVGLAIWIGDWPFLAVPIAVFLTANFAHIPFEEAKMRRQFGEAYDGYAGHVRRWI